MRKLIITALLTSALIVVSANNLALAEEKRNYIKKQSEFDIWYYAFPDHYYGDLADSHFWIRWQIRGHQKCKTKIRLHFVLIYDEKTYPLSFEETCPEYAFTGDRGFALPANIQKIIKDNSRLKTRFSHVDYLN